MNGPDAPHVPVEFDVREFAATATGSRRDKYPRELLAEEPLAIGTLRELRYMVLIERYTMHHLRNLLVTPSHKDAYVTAFLTSWAYEKYWMADTLVAVLEAHGVSQDEIDVEWAPSLRHRGGQVVDRLIPIRNSITANLIGQDFIAIHMAWGMLEERIAQIVYGEIAETAGMSCDVIRELAAQKDRHVEFYSGQAARRLGQSSRAQRLTRLALRHSWLPLSIAARPHGETTQTLRPVLASAAARRKLIELDDAMARLPGLEGTAWATSSLGRLGVLDPAPVHRAALS